MKASSAAATKSPAPRRVKHTDALAFVDQGRSGTVVPDLRARLDAFYSRHPLRTLKAGQPGIVESLKADRDRR